MKYNPIEIEAKWQKFWAENKTFAAKNPVNGSSSLSLEGLGEAYYVLDMFPYPSGAGLHVGHPLGYIASDIVARYKRHKGFNVLHPQGYDSFGLPAEQYAIQTGQHPEKTTLENINRYREQLDKIGFSFDWDREVRTSDADYYKHTQWIFIQLFNSWYNKATDKAENIKTLIKEFEQSGNANVNAVCDERIKNFTAQDWNAYNEETQQKTLLKYRLTYLAESEVNWCPGLGTVLANDEIINGVSERGGHPVIRKKMTQWSMRISAYAERLLQGLNDIDWSESIKESQRNWIGKSVGAIIDFPILAFPKREGTTDAEKKVGYMTGGNNSHLLLEHAKGMRKNPTEAEKILWAELRNSKLDDKFRQQHLIEDYIVDFVCLSKKLIIEVDGPYHNTPEQTEKDDARTLALNIKGYKVIRFTNDELIFGIEQVLEKIRFELSSTQAVVDASTTNTISNTNNTTNLSKTNDTSAQNALEINSTPSPSPLERAGVRIFTTRPDTIYGVTFMTLAPEHPLVQEITTAEYREKVNEYIEKTAKRSERERMADVKTISGVFTGAYAEHPFTKEPIPIWIGDYVLAGYGTGAVMAVPCGDERDYAFANYFCAAEGMPKIKNIFNQDISLEAFYAKEGFELVDSDFLNGLGYKQATKKVIEALEKIGQGSGKVNYRLRDAVFSRQRYWGEPIPVYYKNGIPYTLPVECLPLRLPEVEKYLPTEDGQPPLGNATTWAWNTQTKQVVSSSAVENQTIFPLELNTMPGWAGSSWYWMRYMDPTNPAEFASAEALKYWQNVDLYIGGSEHATGHLLYSRFWNKFLKDIGYAPTEEPFKKLINQGMILGNSAFVYRVMWSITGNPDIFEHTRLPDVFVSQNFKTQNLNEKLNIILQQIFGLNEVGVFGEIVLNPIHVDLSCINDITNELNIEKFRNHPLYSNYKDAVFILEDGTVSSFGSLSSGEGRGEEKYIVGREVEKMSKSKYNVVNPDDICNEYGADTLRLYEMFLGPLEQSKPWNTAGITGVFGFLKKLWRLYAPSNSPEGEEQQQFSISEDEPTAEMYKSLHKTIKKTTEDIENFSFNTSVSQFMICVNELSTLKCNHRKILAPLVVLISPYAPHIAEELWVKLKDLKITELNDYKGISYEPFPIYDEKYLVESEKEYPVSFNGKMRFTIKLPLDLSVAEIEKIIMEDPRTITQLAGTTPKKVIIVPGKVINLVG